MTASIGLSGVHNATFFHDAFVPNLFNNDQVLTTPLNIIDSSVHIAPQGCTDLQTRIHSIHEQMRYQMKIGYVFGKCVRIFIKNMTNIIQEMRTCSLRECLISQQKNLQAVNQQMRILCSSSLTLH